MLYRWKDREYGIVAVFPPVDAETEGGILLIDEIEGFLQDRRGARYNWEVTAVNEMLTRMESLITTWNAIKVKFAQQNCVKWCLIVKLRLIELFRVLAFLRFHPHPAPLPSRESGHYKIGLTVELIL